jgi:hypothetical protein
MSSLENKYREINWYNSLNKLNLSTVCAKQSKYSTLSSYSVNPCLNHDAFITVACGVSYFDLQK